MKTSFKIIALSAVLLSAPTYASQTASKYIDLSKSLTTNAAAVFENGKPAEAQNILEHALVADPANIITLITLGKVHEAQNRMGKGLKYYRQALEIDPNNLNALELQSIAFLAKGLNDRAEKNLTKLTQLCREGCDALTKVEAAVKAYNGKKLMAEVETKEESEPES